MKKTLRKVLPVLALVLVVAVASVGGTIAWLTDKTGTVTNTFTVGNVKIDLYETRMPDGTEGTGADKRIADNAWSAKLIPGSTYAKDPVVVVKANSEKCYLFVKFEEKGNPGAYLDYSSKLKATEWTPLTGITTEAGTSVWYKVVENSTEDQKWYLLDNVVTNSQDARYTNGSVKVKDSIVKTGTTTTDNTPVMPATDADAPALKYTAYAVQFENVTSVTQAWQLASGN